jgi:hypothetical protein
MRVPPIAIEVTALRCMAASVKSRSVKLGSLDDEVDEVVDEVVLDDVELLDIFDSLFVSSLKDDFCESRLGQCVDCDSTTIHSRQFGRTTTHVVERPRHSTQRRVARRT